MGNVIKKKIQGMSWHSKSSLVLLLTLATTLFMFEGWNAPKLAHAVTITRNFQQSTGVSTGADGSTNWVSNSTTKPILDLMDSAVPASSLRTIPAVTTSPTVVYKAYSPVITSNTTIAAAAAVNLWIRESIAVSCTETLTANLYEYNPAGAVGNGTLIGTATGTNGTLGTSVVNFPLTLNNSSYSVTASAGTPKRLRLEIVASSTVAVNLRIYSGTGTASRLLTNETAVADSTPPTAGTVTVTPDISSTYTSAAPTITTIFTDAESAVSSCEYTTNGTTWIAGVVTGTAPTYTCTANPTALSGFLNINMRATSGGGGPTTAAQIQRTVDATVPTDGVLTVAIGDSQNRISWTAAADAAGSGIASYILRFATGATPPANCASGTAVAGSPFSSATLLATHTGLTNGTQYSYRLCATDNLGNSSGGVTGTGTPAPRLASTITSCNSCHGYTTSFGDGSARNVPAGQFPGSHNNHVITSFTACSVCHTPPATTTSADFNHADGTVAVAGTISGGTYGKGSFVVSNTFSPSTCNTTTCHGAASPTWGTNTAQATCTKCHGVNNTTPAAYTADPKTAAPGYNSTGRSTGGATAATDARVGAHDAHLRGLNNLSNPIACTECHSNVNPASASFTGHMNGAGTVTFGTLAKSNTASPGYTSPNCAGTYCHFGKPWSSGGVTYAAKASAAWTATALLTGTPSLTGDCAACHASPPSTAGSHAGVNNINQCNGCHSHVNTDGTFSNKALHVNGIVEGGDCTTCHNQLQGTGTRQVVGTDTVLLSHHMQAATINQNTCVVCHEQTSFGHKVAGDVAVGMFNQDTGAALSYDGTAVTAANLENSCISCHDANGATRLGVNALKPFTDSGDNTAPVDIGWTVGAQAHSANMACFNCHGNSAGVAGNTLTPKNNAHGSATAKMLQYSYNAASEQTFCYNCHGNTPAGGAVNAIQPLFAKTRKHSVESCNNCHNQHQAKPGTHAVQSGTAGGVLNGAGGASLTTTPAFWTAPTAGSFTAKTIVSGTDLEATLCFKCHTANSAGYTAVSPSGAYAMTDIAKAFNPNNVGNFAGTWASNETAGGFHPVLATAGSNLGAINLANLVTTNFAWSTTARNRMTCSDCHGSATTTDPLGPHGSAANFILRGPNTTWNNTMVTTSTGMPSGAFCANCHSATWTSSRFTGTQHYSRSEHRVPCMNCHAAIPHGGPRPGMLVAPAGVAAGVTAYADWEATPYSNPGTGNRLYIKSYPANNTTAWQQANCGCNGTGH